mmetsp:Transcript_5045/g.18376  ORF Transcript_5045/g.18376 Transcript_5045/m.18376 type:complete len:391 (+) Transcript_5045:156-1328(+)
MVAAFVEAGLLSAPGCAAARALPKLRQVAARSLRPALASQRRRCLASRAPGLRVLCSGGEASSLNILLTGGSRGIGFEAAAKFLEQGHTLLIPCRSAERCAETERNLRSRVPNTGSIKTLTCDLASLQQVKDFCAAAKQEMPVIDRLILNAALQFTGAKEIVRSGDGLEMSFAITHLAHFLMAQELLENMSPTGSIVVTASEVHDPESPGGKQGSDAKAGSLEGLERVLAAKERAEPIPDVLIDGSPFEGDKAYKDSKLCNILFVKEMQRRLTEQGSNVEIKCWGPGLVPSTGLFRSGNPVFVGVFTFIADLVGVSLSAEEAGQILVDVAISPEYSDGKGAYFSNEIVGYKQKKVVRSQGSKESNSPELQLKLWDLSEKLISASIQPHTA